MVKYFGAQTGLLASSPRYLLKYKRARLFGKTMQVSARFQLPDCSNNEAISLRNGTDSMEDRNELQKYDIHGHYHAFAKNLLVQATLQCLTIAIHLPEINELIYKN